MANKVQRRIEPAAQRHVSQLYVFIDKRSREQLNRIWPTFNKVPYKYQPDYKKLKEVKDAERN
jgi:hypothetical protein